MTLGNVCNTGRECFRQFNKPYLLNSDGTSIDGTARFSVYPVVNTFFAKSMFALWRVHRFLKNS